MKTTRALLVLTLALANSACSDASSPSDERRPARIEVSTTSLMLDPDGTPAAVAIRAYDAAGAPLDVDVTWTFDAPGIVAMDGPAFAAAGVIGSAFATPHVGDVAGPPVLVFVARPSANAVIVDRTSVLAEPTRIGEPAMVGGRIRVVFAGSAPAPGTLVVARDDLPVLGRVSSIDGASAELVTVPLPEAFEVLSIHAEGRLGAARTGALQQALEFEAGPFECEAELDTELDLDGISYDLAHQLDYAFDLKIEAGAVTHALVRVSGEATLSVDGEITLPDAYEGSIGCEVELFAPPLPLGGPVAAVVSLKVPLGFGVDLELSVKAPASVSVEGSATAAIVVGFEQTGGALVDLTTASLDNHIEPSLDLPELGAVRTSLEVFGFAFARLAAGLTLSSAADVELLELKVGPRLEAELATVAGQIEDTDYRSEAAMELAFELGLGDIEDLLELLGLEDTLSPPELPGVPIAGTPEGSLVFEPASVKEGEATQAIVELDEETVSWLGAYGVDRVEIHRVTAEGTTNLAKVIQPTASGATEFVWDLTPVAADAGRYVAFVVPVAFPFPLELDLDASATLDVGTVGQGPAISIVSLRGYVSAGASAGNASDSQSDISDLIASGGVSISAGASGMHGASGNASSALDWTLSFDAAGNLTAVSGAASAACARAQDDAHSERAEAGARARLTVFIEVSGGAVGFDALWMPSVGTAHIAGTNLSLEKDGVYVYQRQVDSNGSFYEPTGEAPGVLEPGVYELDVSISCSADVSVNVSTNATLTLTP